MAASIKVFIDANIWYSAANKSTGHARHVISGILPNLSIVTSQRALDDARKYLERDVPNRLNVLDVLIKSLDKKLQILNEPSNKISLKAQKSVRDLNDAVILAGAIECEADYLVTWNTKDFIQDKIIDLQIITPAELVKIVMGE